MELELAGFDLGKGKSQSSSSIDEEFFFKKSILPLTLSNIARNWPIYLLKGQEKLPLCLKSFFFFSFSFLLFPPSIRWKEPE